MKWFEPGYCSGCLRRETCTTLCDVAEAYADQDYVPQHEWPTNPKILEALVPDYNWYNDISSNVHLTKKERQIVRLFGLGLNRVDIRELLEMSANALEKAISRLKKKVREMSGFHVS